MGRGIQLDLYWDRRLSLREFGRIEVHKPQKLFFGGETIIAEVQGLLRRNR